jgi:hypothetical protein
MRLAAVAAAVGVVAAAGLGVVAARGEHQLDSARSHLTQAQDTSVPLRQVLSAPDARAATATGARGVGTATVVVSAELDAATLGVSGMPHQAAGRSYQAWLIGPGGPTSAGVLGATGTRAPLLVHGLHGKRTIALTLEPAGGSAQPTTIPFLLLNLPS